MSAPPGGALTPKRESSVAPPPWSLPACEGPQSPDPFCSCPAGCPLCGHLSWAPCPSLPAGLSPEEGLPAVEDHPQQRRGCDVPSLSPGTVPLQAPGRLLLPSPSQLGRPLPASVNPWSLNICLSMVTTPITGVCSETPSGCLRPWTAAGPVHITAFPLHRPCDAVVHAPGREPWRDSHLHNGMT